MSPRRRANLRLLVAGAVAALVLGAASTVGLPPLAAPSVARRGDALCCPEAGRRGGRRYPGRYGRHDGRPDDGWGSGHGAGAGMPWQGRGGDDVAAGGHRGALTHELVVLPLSAGQVVGTRAVGSDGEVDEAGSLGEVSRTRGVGAGDGIAASARAG